MPQPARPRHTWQTVNQSADTYPGLSDRPSRLPLAPPAVAGAGVARHRAPAAPSAKRVEHDQVLHLHEQNENGHVGAGVQPEERATLTADAVSVLALAFAPDSRTLAVALRNRDVKLWGQLLD